jgi:hypothetical protein
MCCEAICFQEGPQSQDRPPNRGLQGEQLVPESCSFDQRRAECSATVWMRMAAIPPPPIIKPRRTIFSRLPPTAKVRHHCSMDSGSNPATEPDLFSAQQPRDTSSLSAGEPKSLRVRKDEPAAGSSPSYALPTNLPSALRHLDSDQLDRLLAAVLAERQARGGKQLPVSDEFSRKKPIKEVAPPLAQGKLNAVRAAFKAGVTPSRIARQSGISQSDVRKALASDESGR